ncbi:peptide-methionine (S)-S-oxide reductase MsrA [Alteribacillus sp. HJP-4]|uniref:peptide-methionine (S)-S-oxide reductase MsrA n=1 Tax=Alteribacillus sp. HJP-4 TaxID=2775394 RepID=UPI0035CD2E94
MQEPFEKATFAGGCFWCMVKPFDEMEGIHQVISGYTGGDLQNPSYEQVKTGTTGHFEAVQILFDPRVFPYKKLLEIYWPQIDPTDGNGQFQDRGPQYRTAIFYHNEKQKELAVQSREEIEESGRFQNEIVTKIMPAEHFYPAEKHHQNFYKTHKKQYEQDRERSGRDEFIAGHWGY